jgi:hypothetical protein
VTRRQQTPAVLSFSDQGWRTYDTRAQSGTPKNFRGTRLHCCPDFFISFAQPASLYCEERVCVCVCVCTYLTAHRLYMKYLCYQTTLQWNIFIQIGSGSKCWLDVYNWVAGLAVTGRISDIGQNVLQSSFQIGSSSSSPSYCHIFFHIALLADKFIEMW